MFEHLGDALTVLRKLRRFSQAEVAERAGIKATQVSRYETNQVQPQLRQLQRLLEALGVNLPALVLALHYAEQLKALVGQETPPAALVRHTVNAWWNSVAEEHLAVSQEVAKVVGTRFRVEHPDEEATDDRAEAFGIALRALRQQAGISQRVAAERAGVRRQVWNYYEAGSQYPVLPTLLRVLDAVETDLEGWAAVMEQTG